MEEGRLGIQTGAKGKPDLFKRNAGARGRRDASRTPAHLPEAFTPTFITTKLFWVGRAALLQFWCLAFVRTLAFHILVVVNS